VNATTYQDQGFYSKPTNHPVSPPLNQIKNNSIDVDVQRSKYSGIKIISTGSAVKGRDPSRSFEDNPLFNGPSTTKASYGNSSIYSKVNVRAERGYETYR
jgi:hypothetical protein